SQRRDAGRVGARVVLPNADTPIILSADHGIGACIASGRRTRAFPLGLCPFRGRPLGNALILAGVACAALGSSLTPFGEAGTAAALALAAALLYAGFVAPQSFQPLRGLLTSVRGTRLTR